MSREKPKIPIYRPELGSKPSKVKTKEISIEVPSRIEENMSGDGVIKTRLDSEIVIQRIAKDLYKNPSAGVRELLANEITAAKRAKEKGMNPEIHVLWDEGERMLVIEGRDSFGIPEDVFIDALTMLGRSANFDGTEVGQFGFGFFSYVMLSDQILVETWPINEDAYSFLAQNAVQFQMLKKPKMKFRGTRLSVVVKEDIDVQKLMIKILECAEIQPVPIYIWGIRTIDRGQYHDAVRITEGMLISQKSLSDVSRRRRGYYGEDGTAKVKIHFETEDFDFYGEYDNYDIGWKIERTAEPVSYLVGMPIGTVPAASIGFDHAVINVKDERRFPPTADRDRLSDEASELIRVKLDKMLFNHFIGKCNYKKGKPTKEQVFFLSLISEMAKHTKTEMSPLIRKSVLLKQDWLKHLGYRNNTVSPLWVLQREWEQDPRYTEMGVTIPAVIADSEISENVIRKAKRFFDSNMNGMFTTRTMKEKQIALDLGLNDGAKVVPYFRTLEKDLDKIPYHRASGRQTDLVKSASIKDLDKADSVVFHTSDLISNALEINRFFTQQPYLFVKAKNLGVVGAFKSSPRVGDFCDASRLGEFYTNIGKVKIEKILESKCKNIYLVPIPWFSDDTGDKFIKTDIFKADNAVVIIDGQDKIINLFLYLKCVLKEKKKNIQLATPKGVLTNIGKDRQKYYWSDVPYPYIEASFFYPLLLTNTKDISENLSEALLNLRPYAKTTPTIIFEIIKDKGFIINEEDTGW